MTCNLEQVIQLFDQIAERTAEKKQNDRTMYQDWNTLQLYQVYRQYYDSLLVSLLWEPGITNKTLDYLEIIIQSRLAEGQVRLARDFGAKLFCQGYQWEGITFSSTAAVHRALDITKHEQKSLAAQVIILVTVERLIVERLLGAIAEAWSIETGKQYVATYLRNASLITVGDIEALLPEGLSEADYNNALERTRIISRFLWMRLTDPA